MAITGNIKTFYLSSLLQLLSNDKKTGILELTDGNDIIQVYLRDGTIINAFGSSRVERLTNYLRSEGIISEEQLEKSLKISAHTEKKIGMVLVEQGYISPELLEGLLHRQIEETLFSMFLWEQGEFEYRDQEFDLSDQIITSFDTMQVVLEASRRVDEISEIKKRVPADHGVLTVTEDNAALQKAKLNTVERAVLSLINGRRSVKGLIHDSGYDELKVYKTLFSLITAGLILAEEKILKRTNGDIQKEIAGQQYGADAPVDNAVQGDLSAEQSAQSQFPRGIFSTAVETPPLDAEKPAQAESSRSIFSTAVETPPLDAEQSAQAESPRGIFNTVLETPQLHAEAPAASDELVLELEPLFKKAATAEEGKAFAADVQKNPDADTELPGKTVVKIDGKLMPEPDFPDEEKRDAQQLDLVGKNEVADALQLSNRRDETQKANAEDLEYARAKRRMLIRAAACAAAVIVLIAAGLLLKPVLFPAPAEQQSAISAADQPPAIKKKPKKPAAQKEQQPVQQKENQTEPDTAATQPGTALDFFQDQKGWFSINLPPGYTASEQPHQGRTSVTIRYGDDVRLTLSIVPETTDWNAEDEMYAVIVKMQGDGTRKVQRYNTLKPAGCPGYVLHFSSEQNQQSAQTALYRFVCFNKNARLEVTSFNFRTPAGRELCGQIYAAIEASFFIYP